MRDVMDPLLSWWAEGRASALATVVATHASAPRRPGASMLVGPGGEAVGSVSGGCVESAVYESGQEALAGAPPVLQRYGVSDGDAFAAALARTGSLLGYRVTVCDARPVFATAARFPGAHEVVVAWPHRYLRAEAEAGRIDSRTALCVLTHDHKFDVPLLEVALRLPDVGYIGAMGSRRTHQDRWNRLTAAGLTEAELKRLSSPIGLDLGARTPEETAVSIAAEIIALKGGGSGLPLTDRPGAIHPDAGL
ncbi:XdhC family protein [Streptomyces sp. NPDC059567]|uniref:XdhC family protein n=1 Tax=Streptomyces sp. NPDC059567 TaxID=3346867 RepID=UPI0036858DA0